MSMGKSRRVRLEMREDAFLDLGKRGRGTAAVLRGEGRDLETEIRVVRIFRRDGRNKVGRRRL